ncbi:3-hydroxyacyl-CoA dehydrogenase NAD-binding domain-containing protein [Rhizorhabdus dicambivorans]|uniref:NADPH nitroreductase n=1 Tax=Rhizorhabdus dicambivorans TaxID=1850238 RepID=A0A2A4FTV7_9SPHN|nr:3-hydroxyacyl-CoA dehydrogenase NAD-binding domain-containing protein [Rhizorhabdus dicambivorans]ATE67159.1 NADPH nitroreductase [Rhizorhabdus dicambivorans]PCE41579.1 NADPH nitroreductase [Rhizorhabdus dicambivorans]
MAAYRGKDDIQTVAAIGSGVIGGGWVAAFLGGGRAVRLYDPAPDAGPKTRDHVARAWPQMAALGLARADDDWSGRLSFHDRLDDAVEGADFVQESTPERIPIKRALFEELDRLVPADILVGSSTSSLPISELQAGLATAGRFVLGHPFNPVHLIPLVEVGGGEATDAAAIDTAQAFYVALGKEPVRLNREIFGHIANRLTSAMFREAVRLVAEDYATVGDIDKAIRFGPALKWAIQGQFTTFHTSGGAGGFADFLPKFAPGIVQRWETMADPPLADPTLQAKLVHQIEEAAAGQSVEEIARRQDMLLMEMLALFAQEGS